MNQNPSSKFRKEILATIGGETLQFCYQCGSCTGGCPTSFYSSFRVRRIIHQSLLGLKDDVLSSKDIWMCTLCFTCQERCPNLIKVTELMLALRNLSTKEGYAPAPLINVLKSLFQTGHEFPFSGYTRKLRKELGLSEIPPLTISSSKALEEVQKLMKIVGIDRLLESGVIKK